MASSCQNTHRSSEIRIGGIWKRGEEMVINANKGGKFVYYINTELSIT